MMKKFSQILGTAICTLLPFMAVAQEPDSLTQRQNIIREARALKNIYKTDEAIDLLSSLVRPESLDEDVFAELADCHFQNGDYEGAAGTYTLLSQKFPDNILYQVRQMACFYRLKAYPQAASAGKAILRRDTITNVATMVGDSFNQMEQYDSALVYYGMSLRKKPLNESVVSKVAKIYLGRKDYDAVISVSDSLLVLDPDNMTVAPIKGLALYSKGEYDSAIDVLERQNSLGNDSYGVHFFLGQSYWQAKVIYKASEELKKAWQIDSSDVNLAISIASVEAEAFMPFDKEIKPWLDRALEMLEPDYAALSRVHQQYGRGYYGRQDSWDNAILHYKEAYRYNPKFISALSTIAYCYEQKKDYRTALEWYEKYLKVAKPGSKGYDFAQERVDYLKGEIFMLEGISR